MILITGLIEFLLHLKQLLRSIGRLFQLFEIISISGANPIPITNQLAPSLASLRSVDGERRAANDQGWWWRMGQVGGPRVGAVTIEEEI